jgi:hypothetical protein
MKELELTQGQVALVDDIDYDYLSQWKWCAAWEYNGFRATRGVYLPNGKHTTLRIHTVIAERMGIDPKLIDHKDQNPLNNCRSNLRAATGTQNQHNRGAQKNSGTGVKGVCFVKKAGKYMAQIRDKGNQYYLGCFDTIPEAASVVQKKREELAEEFTCH